jgi:hypothetical protein
MTRPSSATALLARAQIDDLRFATHDGVLGTAARAVGFEVFGIPRIPRRWRQPTASPRTR